MVKTQQHSTRSHHDGIAVYISGRICQGMAKNPGCASPPEHCKNGSACNVQCWLHATSNRNSRTNKSSHMDGKAQTLRRGLLANPSSERSPTAVSLCLSAAQNRMLRSSGHTDCPSPDSAINIHSLHTLPGATTAFSRRKRSYLPDTHSKHP